MEPISIQIFFPPQSLEIAGFEGRDEIEEPLQDALFDAGLGEVVGGGGGLTGNHVDIDIFSEKDFDQALESIRRVLRRIGAPQDTCIKRYEPREIEYSLEKDSKQNWRWLFRFYVEVATSKEATDITEPVVALVAPLFTLEECRIQQYWKIPEWYEVILQLRPTHESQTLFDDFLDKLGGHWSQQTNSGGDREVIWYEELSPPDIPCLRWAIFQKNINGGDEKQV